MMPDPGTILTALYYLARAAYKPLLKVKRLLMGSKILVLGHSRSGKTSFGNYLTHDDVWADTHQTDPSDIVEETGNRSIDKKGGIQVDLARGVILPGDLSIDKQIDSLKSNTPHAVLIILSPLTREDEGISEHVGWLPASLWLKRYLETFRQLITYIDGATIKDDGITRALRCMMVILNKSDLVDQKIADAICEDLRTVVRQTLDGLLPSANNSVPVRLCTLCKDKGGILATNKIIKEVAECLKKPPLFKK